MRRPGIAESAAKHLLAWRQSRELGRPEVVARMGKMHPDQPPYDQATLAKWESGEIPIRANEMWALGRVYRVHPMWLFLPPGPETEQKMRAVDVVQRARKTLPAEVDEWLEDGGSLVERAKRVRARSRAAIHRAKVLVVTAGTAAAIATATCEQASMLCEQAEALHRIA